MAEQKDEEADCIVVPDSQEVSGYQYSSCMTLHDVAAGTNINAYRFKPRQIPDEPGGAEPQVAGEGGAEEVPAAGQEQPGPPGGEFPGHGGGGDGNQGGAGDGGEGGDPPEEEAEEDEEEEEEEEAEEQVVTTSSSSGPSLPPLVPADPERVLRLGLVPFFFDEERVSEGSMVMHSETEPEPEPQAEQEVTSSESGGGYSDAPTAPLRGSDTESSRGQGHVSTPSTGGLRSPGASSHDVSSAVSTLSSLSSSGETHQPPPQVPSTSGLCHKRPMTRKAGPRTTKRQKLDVSSSTDTSGRDTTSTATTTTTTSDTSHDDGPGGSGAPGDRSCGASGGERSRDMSGDKADPKRKTTKDSDQPGTSGLGRKAAGEPVSGTTGNVTKASRGISAEKNASEEVMVLGTLSLSQDDPYSLSCVPPSQGEYDGLLPLLFPGSPTDNCATANRDEGQENPVLASRLSKPSAREFQQWQSMSILSSPDYSSIDQEDQRELSQIPSSIAEEQNTSSGFQRMEKGTVVRVEVSMDSSDDSVQFMGFENSAVAVRSQISGGFESQNLHLHLTQSQENSAALKSGIRYPIPAAVDALPGASQMSTCSMTAEPLHFDDSPSGKDAVRLSEVKHGESEAVERITIQKRSLHVNPEEKKKALKSEETDEEGPVISLVMEEGHSRSHSVASKKSERSPSPEVGRTDFPSFRLDRPVLDSMVDLENCPQKLKTPQLQRTLETNQPSVGMEVCSAISLDQGLKAKKPVVKKMLKFAKKEVEGKKKKKNLPSKKRTGPSTEPRAKKGGERSALKHEKRGQGARLVRQGSPDTICESLVEDSQTLEYHFTSVKKSNRADVGTRRLESVASEVIPVISESPTAVTPHSVTAVGPEARVVGEVVPGQVKNLEITPVTVKEHLQSRQSFLSSSQSPLRDSSVFAVAKKSQKRVASDSLVLKPPPKLVRRSSNQSSGVSSGEVLHVTTTIRSVIERSSTYVMEFRGGKFVKSTFMREEEKLLSREMDTYEEILSPVSTSRSVHSLSSGDMGDVSSLEHKSSTTLTPSNSEISSHVVRAEVTLVGIADHARSFGAGDQSKTEMAGGRSSTGSLRISDVLFSELESERGSLGKNNQRSSGSLFSSIELPPYIREELATGQRISDTSRKSDSSAVDAHNRSDRQPPARVSSDDSLFRQPLPPMFKRRSSGSSGSASGIPRKDSIPVSGLSDRESGDRGRDDQRNSTSVPSSDVADGKKSRGHADETGMPSDAQESTGSEIPDTCLSTDSISSRSGTFGIIKSETCSATVASEADLGTVSSVVAKTTDTVSMSAGKTPGRGSSRKHRVPPTPGLDPGTPVLAKWKDHHFYPGEVVSCEDRSKCRVLFDDGNQLTVKTDHLILVSLVPVGQSVLADCGSGWNELVTVVSHWAQGEERGYVVRKDSETSPHDIRVQRSQISLNKEQAASIMAAQSQSGTPDTMPENSGNSLNPEDRTAEQVDTVLPPDKLPTRAEGSEGLAQLCLSPCLIDSSAKSLEPGLPVFARWSDRHFYPAYVRSLISAEACLVAFEDGSEYRASLVDIFVCDLLPCNLEVMAQREGVDWSEVAMVIRHFEDGDSVGYVVEFGNGSQSRLTRQGVTLNPLQAGFVMSGLRSKIPETGTLANISLENLQEGKRRRIPGSASKGSPYETPNRTPPDSSRLQKSRSQRKKPTLQSGKKSSSVKKEEVVEGKNSAPELSCGASSKVKLGTKTLRKHFVTEMNQMNPRATSTPTPKRVRETGDLSPPFKTMLDSPDPGKKTSKKFKTVLFPESKGPLLPPGSLVFREMTFILTHVEKTAEQKEQDRQIAPLSPCDTSTTSASPFVGSFADDGKVPFDKFYLCEQIESGGGEVIDEFDLERVGLGERFFLISDTHQRTRKYFCALAVGIPCVSHLWIRDSCENCALEDYRNYMLPAGISLESQQPVKWQNEQRPLAGLKVVVSTENRNFVDVWIEILEAAGCQLIQKIPARNTVEHVVDVVVSDGDISAATWQLAQRRGISVVSSEWVVQCLVTGSRLDYACHPKYCLEHEWT